MTKEDVFNKYGDAQLSGYAAFKAMDEWAKAYGKWLYEQPKGVISGNNNEKLYQLFINHTTNERNEL
jgi:hypothetical protein